jgi:hypothetical protein
MELEFSAPLRIGVEDEHVSPSLRLKEDHDRVPPSVVTGHDNPHPVPLHPFCLDPQIERHLSLILKYEHRRPFCEGRGIRELTMARTHGSKYNAQLHRQDHKSM